MSQQESMQRIDKFIKQLDAHDVILEPEKLGKRYGYYQRTKSFFGYKEQYVGTFSEMLSRHLSKYQQAKSTSDSWLLTLVIDDALYWINLAYSNNIVKPSDGIYRKYDDCLDQIKELTKTLKEKEDELQQVSVELLQCEAEKKSYKHQLGEMKKSGRNT